MQIKEKGWEEKIQTIDINKLVSKKMPWSAKGFASFLFHFVFLVVLLFFKSRT